MNAFRPELLESDEFGFDETSIILLDELSQARIIDESLRRCFSLRVASRILLLIYRNGRESEENNFITCMDSITRRMTEVFTAFFEFIKPDNSKPGFNHLIAMMNDAIIEFITNEYVLGFKTNGVIKPLSVSQISDLLNNIHITQSYRFLSDDNDNLISLATQQEPDLETIRKVALTNVWIKLYSKFKNTETDDTDKRFEKIISELLIIFVHEVDDSIRDKLATCGPVVVNGVLIQTYYSTFCGLLCEIIQYKFQHNENLRDADDSVILEEIKTEFMSAKDKIKEHLHFLTKVHYENTTNE